MAVCSIPYRDQRMVSLALLAQFDDFFWRYLARHSCQWYVQASLTELRVPSACALRNIVQFVATVFLRVTITSDRAGIGFSSCIQLVDGANADSRLWTPQSEIGDA
jgi:hypothetical protein